MTLKLKAYFVIFSILGNLLALNDGQIISAEIPASAYLEILAEKSEKKSRRAAKMGVYFWSAWGLLFYQAEALPINRDIPGSGYAVGTGCFVAAIASRVRGLSKKPISKTKKLYQDINKHEDYAIKQMAAYDTLVLLANSSRKNRNSKGSPPQSLESALILGALKSISTIEEKALAGFLKQTPLEQVF